MIFAQEFQIKRINFSPIGQEVEITYDLEGNAEQIYVVNVTLKKESNPEFEYIPQKLRGDYGKGQFAGFGRKIFWAILFDNGSKFVGNDYYFEIEVEKYIPGNFPWLYVVGGSGIVSGIVYYLLTHGQPQSTTTPATGLPTPPNRPLN